MALGDVDDLSCPQHGQGQNVVLYCYTCHYPVCARCVACSKPSFDSDSVHREHLFLEISEAYDLFRVSWKVTCF